MKLLSAFIGILVSFGLAAQDYPARPVRMLIGYPPGGGMDAIARVLGAKLSELAARDVQESFARQGATPTPSAPEALGAQIAEEVKRWAAVVKEAGIKAE